MDFEVDAKQQRRREKIGLVVFVLSILLIFAAVILYLFLSHSLDVTASDIDSSVGQLDGYLTVVFEGDNSAYQKKPELSDKILKKATDLLNIENIQDSNKQESSVNTEKATISNVSHFYKEKSATLCRIKCNDFEVYKDGEIFERGNWKVGVLSINQDTSNEILKSQNDSTHLNNLKNNIKKLRRKNSADLIILLCPDLKISSFIENEVDCVLYKNLQEDIPENGKQLGNCYVMRIPETGAIGSILSSPAKMITGRVYTEVEISE